MQRFMSAVYRVGVEGGGGGGGGCVWKKCFALYSENNANELLPSSTFKTIAYYSHSERIRVIDCADFSSLKMESWRGLIILSPTMWWSHTLRGGDRCRDAASWHPLVAVKLEFSLSPPIAQAISHAHVTQSAAQMFLVESQGGEWKHTHINAWLSMSLYCPIAEKNKIKKELEKTRRLGLAKRW